MSESNPWRTLTSDLRYDSPWISVTHHDVLTPSGTPGIYGTVHFKNHALGVVVLDEEMNTWLVGQYRFPLGRYSWEIPEGGGDRSDRLESARRELKEETGIEAATWQLLFDDLALSNSVTDEVATLYLATDLTFGEASPDETERLELLKLPFEDAVTMALDGRITDIMSVLAILKVHLMHLQGELKG